MDDEFKIIHLCNGYFIMDRGWAYEYALRHRCTNNYMSGQPVMTGYCQGCRVKTSNKIMFMYNLWKVNKGRTEGDNQGSPWWKEQKQNET